MYIYNKLPFSFYIFITFLCCITGCPGPHDAHGPQDQCTYVCWTSSSIIRLEAKEALRLLYLEENASAYYGIYLPHLHFWVSLHLRT